LVWYKKCHNKGKYFFSVWVVVLHDALLVLLEAAVVVAEAAAVEVAAD
jgi:hypothetical protein